MRFSETYKSIPVLEPADYQAGIDGDSIDMSRLHSVVIPLNFGALTGDAVLKIYSGASAGTKTTALAFQYRVSDADFKASGADGLGALVDVAATGLTLTAATFDHKHLIIELRATEMTEGEEWLTVELSAAADVLTLACTAWGHPRYAAHDGPTVVDSA